jgi:choloylglycine hydrolase
MCTRVFWSNNDVAMVVARTTDMWGASRPRVVWQPAGLTRTRDDDPAALSWTSRFDTLVVKEERSLPLEGVNAEGLVAHALMFTTAEYPAPDARRAVHITDWVHFVLDNCATVAEAVAAHDGVRLVSDRVHEMDLGVHLVLEDPSGDSAVIEPVARELLINHDADIRVVANAPSYPEQVANRAQYRNFGGELPPPGDITSVDRFARASYYLHYLPEPATPQEAVAGVVQVVTTTAKPPGAPYPDGADYPTRWISAFDLTNRDLYFWNRNSPAACWVQVPQLASVRARAHLDLDDPSLVGDITEQLVDAAAD